MFSTKQGSHYLFETRTEPKTPLVVLENASSADSRIPVAAPDLSGNEVNYVMECLRSTWISSKGHFLDQFERGFARFCGVNNAIAVCNGTAALHIALCALGVGRDDEIIVPTLTFVSTANAVSYCQATPVFADCDPRTFNIRLEGLESLVTKKTKGIIVTHLYGHPVDCDPILALAKRHGLFVVEDAAEAHGAQYRGQTVGAIGDCATFSFYGNKIITTGEGGMVTTNDDALAERIRLLRSQGMQAGRRYWFPVIGYNYRMTNICAALGLAQLERIEQALAARKRVAEWYSHYLSGNPGFILPATEPWATHAFWMYTILLTDRVTKSRDEIMKLLDEKGIETRPVFYPMHQMPPYRSGKQHFPNADYCSSRGINLPTHSLLTEEDVSRVCQGLSDVTV
jgi:perosamine synthetase